MIHLPQARQEPLHAFTTRVLWAAGLVCAATAFVYADRGGYRDANEDGLTLLDCLYYSAVSLSTTGYGDITPVSSRARLTNILFVTPARLLFLLILVETTLELLTAEYRNGRRIRRWRHNLSEHVIVCGYGTKGRAAVATLLQNGHDKSQIVVVEIQPAALRQAAADGLAVVEGDAARSSVLLQAGVERCQSVIVASDRDEVSVLITLTVRQLTSGQVRILAAVREQENAALLKQSGAHHVVVSSSTAGRMLGLTMATPPLIDVMENLLTPGHHMALAVRPARRAEVGNDPRQLDALVVALIRRGQVLPLGGSETDCVRTGDVLAVLGSASS